jgi:hypothetical protein
MKGCNDFLKPSQSIIVGLNKLTGVAKVEYFIRLSTSINAVKFLLHQGLAFRGHDESVDSKNRGNFLELVKLMAEQNEKIKKVVLRNAPENHQMAAPEIQKDNTNCFAEVKLFIYYILFLLPMCQISRMTNIFLCTGHSGFGYNRNWRWCFLPIG